jgi:hypothetical protein
MSPQAKKPSPFDEAEAWEGGKALFDEGSHVVTISSAEGDTSQSGNPMIVFNFEDDTHSIRDWVGYHPDFLAKIVAVFDAAGVKRPQDGEFDPQDSFRLTDKTIARLVGKQLGILVRNEPDNRSDHAGEMRPKVQGYTKPAEVEAEEDPFAGVAAEVAEEADPGF